MKKAYDTSFAVWSLNCASSLPELASSRIGPSGRFEGIKTSVLNHAG
jgi:hypothetical protein